MLWYTHFAPEGSAQILWHGSKSTCLEVIHWLYDLGQVPWPLWASVSTWSYITAFFSSNISGLTLKCREAQTNKNPLKNSSSTLYHARYHFPMQHVSIATVTPGSVLSPGMQRWTTETLFSWSSLVILACVCVFFFQIDFIFLEKFKIYKKKKKKGGGLPGSSG